MRELVRAFKPTIIVLLEPKISGEAADKVCKKLGKKRWVRSDGAQWWGVGRNEEEASMKLLEAGRSFLHLEVRFGDGRMWLLMAVYANPHTSVRRFLWNHFDELEVSCVRI